MRGIHFAGLPSTRKNHQSVAYLNPVTTAQGVPRNNLAIDSRAVAAVQIQQFPGAILLHPNLGMRSRCLGVKKLNIAASFASQPQNGLRKLKVATLIATAHNKQRRHENPENNRE